MPAASGGCGSTRRRSSGSTKANLSLRRKQQFATVGPATKEQLELGLNAKGLAPTARLKALPPGGMCQYAVRLSAPGDIDAELLGWVRAAYDAAG